MISSNRGFEWINHKEFNLNDYTSNSSKAFLLDVDLQYPKELRELHSYYPVALDKTEIKEKMLPWYQVRIADLPIGNFKKLMPNFFW